MGTERIILIAILLAVSSVDRGSLAADAPVINVSSNTPLVKMAPRTRGRFIRLPSLDFELTVEAVCPFGLQPQSVTLSIADTRMTLAAEDIAAQVAAPISITVPAAQIAPFAAETFCRSDDVDTQSASLVTFSSALAAQASLRCDDASNQAITYVSHPLDVSVSCEAEVPDEDMPGSD